MVTVQNPKKSQLAKKPACSLAVNVSLGLPLPFLPFRLWLPVTRGVGLQPANSVLSFVLCAVLVVSYVQAFRVVAIPQSGLLAQVSSLWLPSGHSGPILKKHCSPGLLAQPLLASGGCRHLRCFSAGIYRWAHNLWVLIIYLFFLPVMLPSVVPRLATDSAVRVFPGVWKLLSFLRLPSQDGAPSLSLLSLFLSFIFFRTSFRR